MGAHAGPEGDKFRALFEAAHDAMLLADDDRRYVDANPAACRLLGRSRDELLALRVEDVTPAGVDVEAAWRSFLGRGEMSGEYVMARPDGTAVEVEFQATANVVPGQHLSVMRDVSSRKRAERERDESNARLREAHDRANQIVLALQRSMLPGTLAVDGLEVATRYLPATDAVHVGGDWYDLVEVGPQRIALAVGDVMGHGVAAAGLMGQLRSALSAAFHADSSPARALAILDTYARSLAEPLMATVVAAVLDLEHRTLTYSSAGHPPALLCGDAARFLDQATAPPLATTHEAEARPKATVELPAGAMLVLFTDGLIERRGRDIDDGLRRLADAVRPLAGEDPETVADALTSALLPADGNTDDDVALVVVRL